MANDSNSSVIVGIVAIVVILAVAYFGFVFFKNQNMNPTNDTGTTAGVDVNVGTSGNSPSSTNPY